MTIKRLPVDLLADSPRERAFGQRAVFIQLSVMMLLEFVVFGAWFATLGLVLHSQGWAAYVEDSTWKSFPLREVRGIVDRWVRWWEAIELR